MEDYSNEIKVVKNIMRECGRKYAIGGQQINSQGLQNCFMKYGSIFSNAKSDSENWMM